MTTTLYDQRQDHDVTALQARNRERETNQRLRVLLFWCIATAAGAAAGALIAAVR